MIIPVGAPDDQAVLLEWLKPQVALYATARAPSLPQRLEGWTAVNTLASGTSAHAIAWTGDVPLVPNGFESDHLAHGVRLLGHTAAWLPKR